MKINNKKKVKKEWKEIVEMQNNAKFDNWEDFEIAKEICLLFSFSLIKISLKNVETFFEISSLFKSYSEILARS